MRGILTKVSEKSDTLDTSVVWFWIAGDWGVVIWAKRVRKVKPNLTLAASYLAGNQNP